MICKWGDNTESDNALRGYTTLQQTLRCWACVEDYISVPYLEIMIDYDTTKICKLFTVANKSEWH